MQKPFAALALLLLSGCEMPALGLQPRYGRFSVRGTAGASSSGTVGSGDLEQAGLDSADSFAGRLDFKAGSPHLIGLAQAPRFTGSGRLEVDISDGTNTITTGTDVTSEFDLEQYDLALVFDLIPGDTVEVALGIGAAYLDLALEFEGLVGPTLTTVATEVQVPVPLAAVAASVWIGRTQVAAFVGAMEYEVDNDSILYVEGDVYARWKLFGGHELWRTSLFVGYRHTQVELEYDDEDTRVDVDLALGGIYLGVELSL